METRDLNNEFMAEVLKNEAWEELSSEFAWTEPLLEKYRSKVVWKEISRNQYIVWTASMVEKFRHKIDWDEFSDAYAEGLFTVEFIEKYKNCWNWKNLTRNRSVNHTTELLEQFADYWDWSEVIDYRDELFSTGFLEKYQGRIPASSLQRSSLWQKLLEDEKKKIKVQMLA